MGGSVGTLLFVELVASSEERKMEVGKSLAVMRVKGRC